MELKNTNNDYKHWLEQVKSRILTARIKASLAANAELISFYWDLGKMMSEVSVTAEWGNNWLGRLSNDLRKDFPDMEGFAKTNLYNIRRLYNFINKMNFSTSLVEKFRGGIMLKFSPRQKVQKKLIFISSKP